METKERTSSTARAVHVIDLTGGDDDDKDDEENLNRKPAAKNRAKDVKKLNKKTADKPRGARNANNNKSNGTETTTEYKQPSARKPLTIRADDTNGQAVEFVDLTNADDDDDDDDAVVTMCSWCGLRNTSNVLECAVCSNPLVDSGAATFAPFHSIQSDAMYAQSLQENENAQIELHERRKQHEAKSMLETHDGLAWTFIDKVIAMHKSLSSTKEVESVELLAFDDLVFLAKKFISCRDAFAKEGKSCTVEIRYHYTHERNLNSIKEDGLMTSEERRANNVKSERDRSSKMTAHYGTGVYTANNPFAFHGMYGDVGLIVLILKGNMKRVVHREKVDASVDSVLGNKLMDANSPLAGSDVIKLLDETVLKQSSQCLPLLKFPESIILFDNDHACGNDAVWKTHKKIQKLIDDFFHDGRRTKLQRAVASNFAKRCTRRRLAPPVTHVPPVSQSLQAPPAQHPSPQPPVQQQQQQQQQQQPAAGVSSLSVPAQPLAQQVAPAAQSQQQLTGAPNPPQPPTQPQQPGAKTSAPPVAAQPPVQQASTSQPRQQAPPMPPGPSMKLHHPTAKAAAPPAVAQHPVQQPTATQPQGQLPAATMLTLPSTQTRQLAAMASASQQPPALPAQHPRQQLPSNAPVAAQSSASQAPVMQSQASLIQRSGAEAFPFPLELEYVAPQSLLPRCDGMLIPVATIKLDCSICFESMLGEDSVKLATCGHAFHRNCITDGLSKKPVCPICRKAVGEPAGTCPSGTMSIDKIDGKCAGFDNDSTGTIRIVYSLPSGMQRSYHPNPNEAFPKTERTAYLPHNENGCNLLKRLVYAWMHGLTFTVGTSLATGRPNSITWASIHHKTSMKPGAPHGFPDPLFFDNCHCELDALGVPPEAAISISTMTSQT